MSRQAHNPRRPALRGALLSVGIAASAVLASALAVVASTHACRDLYARLQTLETERWGLEEEYSRLLLEQSTWASHHRVEQVATQDLAMQAPEPGRRQVVTP